MAEGDKYEERCFECRFFYQEGPGHFCRRFPPTMVMLMGQAAIALDHRGQQPHPIPVSSYPPIQRLGWCGEFERKMEGTA